LILNNLQRDKSPGQEGKEMLWLEKTKRQMNAAGQGTRNDTSPQLGQSSFRWDEEVAKEIGASKNTVRRATEVYRFAYPDQYVHNDLQNLQRHLEA